MPRGTRLAAGVIAGFLVTGLATSGTAANAEPASRQGHDRLVDDTARVRPVPPVRNARSQHQHTRSVASKAPATLRDETGLTVTIDRMSPATLTAGSSLEMSGTVTNDADHGWFDLQVYLEMSLTPATTKSALDALAVTDDQAYGDKVLEFGLFDQIGGLKPGESTSYHLSIPFNKLPGPKTVGVYRVGATVLGTQPGITRDPNADARASTTIPIVDPDALTQSTRIVTMIPITAPVARQPDGAFVDDRLAGEVAPGGRLRNLMDYAQSAPDESLELAVDPALIDAIDDMDSPNGYQVLSLAAARSGEPPQSGTGQASAAAWLAEFSEVKKRQRVTLLPWGAPDTSALAEENAAGVVGSAVRASRRFAAQNQIPNTSDVVDWQGNGAATRRGLALADAAGASLHIVSQATLSKLELDDNGYPPPWVSVNTRSSLPLDTVVSRSDVGGQPVLPTTDSLQFRQDVLAEATVRAISSTVDPVSVVAVPFHWDPGIVPPDLDLDAAFVSPQITTSLLAPVVAGAALPYVGPVQPATATPGYSAGQINAIHRLRSVGKVYTDLLSANRVISASFDQQYAMSGSAAWQWQPKRGEALTRRNAKAMATQVAKVTVSGPDFVALSSDSGRFPLTVDNGLDVAVTVSLRLIPANPALSFEPLQPFVIGPLTKQDVEVVSQALGSGVTSVRARLATSSDRPFGRPWTFDVRATRIGLAIWVLMGVLGAALFSSAAVRIVRRIRAGGFTPRGDQP